MKVYLVSESGCRTAFKITKARVLTDLDEIITKTVEEVLLQDIEYFNYRGTTLAGVTIKRLVSWGNYLNVYSTEIDSTDFAKKVKEKDWKEIVEDYMHRNEASWSIAEACIAIKRRKHERIS